MSQIALFLVVDSLLVLGALSLVLTLPGTWFMVLVMAAGLWLFPDLTPYEWFHVSIAVSIAVAAEVFEFVSGILGVKKTGGSRRASWGALLGGLIGVLVGTGFFPPVGTFIGLFAGTFLGTWLMERNVNPEGSKKVALGATVARVFGLLAKFLAAGAILALVIFPQYQALFDSAANSN